VSFFLLFFMLAASAANESDLESTRAEEISGQSPSSVDSETSLDKIAIPEDTTQRFLVRELKISGNKLLSTKELLYHLPAKYVVSVQEDGKSVQQVYDFRILYELIRYHGSGEEVSLRTIQGLTKYILSVYQEKGYGGIYVYVPAEAVEGGNKLVDEILPIQVIEGRIAQISVDSYDFDRNPREKGFLKNSVIESWSPVREGDVIQKKKLDDFVRLLNLNPDRYISPVISRSSEPNALNLSYDVYETSPWHRYIQIDNAGTRNRQWSPRVGLVNTNVLGIDDRFSVMFQAPLDRSIEDEYAVFGSYDVPIFTPRLRLNLYSGYSKFDIPEANINFLGNGSFYGSILSYNVLQINSWFFDVTGSFSNETSKVTPSLGIASDVDMELWGVGMNIHHSDDMSSTSLTFNRSENIGGSNKASFEEARTDTDPDFTIYNLGATHSQYLDSTKVNRISGSFRSITSDERLVPAKMTTFGGLYSVRGYKEDEIVADGGILISGQYEFDLIKADEAYRNQQEISWWDETNKPPLRKLAPVAFIDSGRAKIKNPASGESAVRELCSIGTGLIIETEDNFSANIYYGWALRGTDDTDIGDGRLNVSFLKRF
jgi:hemolysin activation/secretion protein